MQTKKVMCTLMAAFLVVNTTLQPVLATGDLLINSQTTKTRQLTVGSDTATTNGSTDAVQITADVTTTKQLPTTKKQLPTQTTDVQAQQHVLAGDPNGGACIAKIETCNNIDDDCDGLVDEGLNCTTACPDADADGICDAVDNCKFVANPNQADADGDGIGDVCEENGCIAKIEICNQLDDDCDGLVDEGLDCSTPCPDADGDGICNAVDNCKFTANPNQADADGDGVGDVCDNCVNVSNANQADSDGDGIGDACETTDICDPHVFVSCETTEDLNNPLNYGNQYECSELIKCYAHFANYNSPTCKIQYEGTIKALTGGTVVDDPNFVEGTDCQNEDDGVWFEHEDAECALNTATNTVECNGTLYGVQNQNGANDCNPNTHDDVADVGFWVQLDTCDNCSPYFELEIAYTDINLVGGGQFVDQNYGNNVDTYTHDIDNSANPLCNGGCVDTDNDGICDTVDNCVNTYNPNQADIDGDGVGDVCDNCVTTYNPNQADSDNDGIGDACETIPCIDTDGDGICNPVDNCVTTYNPNQADADGDGVGDVCDNCVNTYNPNQADSDNDGIGDACEVVDVCPDPISNIVVTSHVYDQVINGAIVSVFSGTVQGNAVKVDVIVGGTTYTDVTIVNGVWSVNNVLLPVVGQNPITILAYHANGNAQCIFGTYFQLIRTQNSIITTCTDTQVTPQQVELNQGNFTITCGGTNANSYAVKVTRPNNTTTTISIPNGGNVLQVAGAMTGTYNFQCIAYGSPTAYCPVATGVVVQTLVCPDPITNFTLSSHAAAGQPGDPNLVSTPTVTMTGTIAGGYGSVEIIGLNAQGQMVVVATATILNGVWSATVPVSAVNGAVTAFWIKAKHLNSNDLCTETIDVRFKFVSGNQCTDPITNLTIGSHFSGQVVNSSPITLTGLVQGGVLKVEVMVGVTVYQATILNGVWSVTLPLVAGTNSIWVKAYPNDADCSPVQKDIVIKYQPNLITTCTETQLQPTSVALNQGDFTISCQGTNVTSFKVQVTQPNGFVTYLTTPINNAGNQFQFTPLLVGGYTFACHAEGFNDTICPSVGGTVTNTTQCTAPLNYMHIDAPLSGLITSASTILVQGTILPSLNVQSVLVNGIVATISGSVYTAIVPLQLGTNKILATATSIDADCPTLFAETTVYRTGGGSCDYLLPPEAVTITSPFSGAVFNTNSIVVSGTSWTDIVSLTIKVNGGTVRTVTPVNGLWSGSVALVSGVNTIEVIGYLSDPTCQPVSSSVVIKNTTSDGICLDTIALTVTEPTNNLSVTTSSVLVQGVVLGSGITLKVGNSTVIPNANGEYSFMYPLVIGTNTLVITASNGDDDCTKTTTVNVVRRSSGGGGGGRRSSITCGNGYLDRYEQCDDGNYRNGDGCSSSCQLEQLCGNNKIEAGETCDDGNTRNGDGCNAVCRLEDIDLKREVIKRVKSRPQPFVFVAPKILPKTGISSRVTPARQIK